VARCLLFAILSLLAGLGSHSANADEIVQVPDTIEARVLGCAPCHGDHGQGTKNDYFPRLSGKPSGYLYNQLVAFRSGRRRYPPMNYLLEFMPDPFLHAIADYFAAQRPPLPARTSFPVDQDVLALGQALVTHGDPKRAIPACAGCHGPAFTGMEPAIPGLLGLQPNYITAQLGAWRYGNRTAAAPDCMQIVAGHLTEADLTAVAAFLSTLPSPADPTPARHGSLPMPLACGSQPN
jgi:cytochrome c553